MIPGADFDDLLGGVAIGGKDDLPEGKAGMADKLVGKTQKVRVPIVGLRISAERHLQVVGKYTHNVELHEKGELREAGGKAAVAGQARVPHD